MTTRIGRSSGDSGALDAAELDEQRQVGLARLPQHELAQRRRARVIASVTVICPSGRLDAVGVDALARPAP
jgi:hypothetical protein